MNRNRVVILAVALAAALGAIPARAQPDVRVTVLFDAFGEDPALRLDWGFAALIEYGGRRVLFDTGNDAEAFAHNVRALGVDLTRLDFVVLSHRHGDHTDGLRHLLAVNPDVTIYVPDDEYFGGPTPPAFYRRTAPDLPQRMRYFRGETPAVVPHGSPWRGANFVRVDSTREVLPGFVLVRNVSPTRVFGETPELSLVVETPQGRVLMVGCSHPGIERILRSAGADDRPVRLVVGGLHLVTESEAEISRLAVALRDDLRVGGVAPGHCTGEPAFAVLTRVFGAEYRYAGVGTVLEFP